jgi:glycosyltransferase 2 family protein
MKKKILKFSVKVIVSLGFLFWVVYKVDWGQFFQEIEKIGLLEVSAYLLVVIIGITVSSYKWKVLADFKGIHRPLSDYVKLYLTGTFINNFMPSFIGGDTYKSYELGKEDRKFVESASTVMMDRITGLFGATILALVFSLVNVSRVLESKALIIVNVILLLSLFFDIFAAKIKHFSIFHGLVKMIPEKILKFIRELDTYNHNSRVLTKAIIWAFVFDFIGIALANYILFYALGIKIGVVDYLSVIFLISVISSVPVSVNNIGIKEWAYITFFGVFGLGATSVTTVAIVSRFLQMFLSFFAMPIYLRSRK